jgi:hypothetical protein
MHTYVHPHTYHLVPASPSWQKYPWQSHIHRSSPWWVWCSLYVWPSSARAVDSRWFRSPPRNMPVHVYVNVCMYVSTCISVMLSLCVTFQRTCRRSSLISISSEKYACACVCKCMHVCFYVYKCDALFMCDLPARVLWAVVDSRNRPVHVYVSKCMHYTKFLRV